MNATTVMDLHFMREASCGCERINTAKITNFLSFFLSQKILISFFLWVKTDLFINFWSSPLSLSFVAYSFKAQNEQKLFAYPQFPFIRVSILERKKLFTSSGLKYDKQFVSKLRHNSFIKLFFVNSINRLI